MKTVYLERRAINQLNHDSIYDTTKYRYFMYVEIRVKGGKKND